MNIPTDLQGIRVLRDENDHIEYTSFCSRARKIQQIARSFRTLWSIDGIEPWDSSCLATEGIRGVSSGTRQSILYVLSVWNPEAPEFFGLEPFCIHDALYHWDSEHRTAFLTWARDPWWV